MYNEENAIGRCLESIFQQDYPVECIEIIIVDGKSTDASHSRVHEWINQHPNIHLLENPHKRTPLSLNIGIKHARGEVIIILGAHTKIDRRFVSLNIHYMQTQQVKCTGGTQINIGETYIQQAIGHAMGSGFGIPSAPYRYYRKPAFVDTVVYAAYHRALFEQIGYFNEKIHIAEDAELNWRIRNAGNRIFFTPEIISYYYPRKKIHRLAYQFFDYGISRVNVIKQHLNAIKAIHLIPPIFVVTTLFCLLLAVAYPFSLKILGCAWGIYLVYLTIASITASLQIKTFRYSPVLPILFMAMQLSWGTGFLVGLIKTYKQNPT